MSEIATHIIAYIDSHNLLTGTDGHFTHKVNLPKQNNFDSVCVLQASIPKSYYLIAAGANTFMLTENDQEVIVEIPIGNYTRKSLATVLTSLLRASSPNQLYYTVTIPNSATEADTGKFTFRVQISAQLAQVPLYAISFSFSRSYQPCESLGFPIASTNFFNAGTLLSTNVCRLQSKSTIYIKSNCVDNGGSGVLQAIFGSEPDLGVINFQVGTAGGIAANRKELVINRTNNYIFVISDEDGVELDTNGLSVTFSLLLWDSQKYTYFASK